MVVLKLHSATLLETLVASAIVLVVFVVGSMSISNIFLGTIKNETYEFYNRISELEYKSLNNKISLPLFEDTNKWNIAIEKKEALVVLTALHKKSDLEVIKKLIYE